MEAMRFRENATWWCVAPLIVNTRFESRGDVVMLLVGMLFFSVFEGPAAYISSCSNE